jgi:1-acyl-sn-glycerol-3-phosphate acyltransferase
MYGLKVIHRERLRGPGISVMNHCLHVEWFFLWHAVRPRYIRFTAEQANMQRKDLGWFNYALGVIGIPSENPMAVAPAISHAAARGELIHFFPEGVLKRRNQKPEGFMIGAAWFACRHDIPLIPVAEILTARRLEAVFPWWPPKVTLIVGDALMPGDFRRENERLRNRARRLSEEAERIIRETIREFPFPKRG